MADRAAIHRARWVARFRATPGVCLQASTYARLMWLWLLNPAIAATSPSGVIVVSIRCLARRSLAMDAPAAGKTCPPSRQPLSGRGQMPSAAAKQSNDMRRGVSSKRPVRTALA